MNKLSKIILIIVGLVLVIFITTFIRQNKLQNADTKEFYSTIYDNMDSIVFRVEQMNQKFDKLTLEEKMKYSSDINGQFFLLQNYIENSKRFLYKHDYKLNKINSHRMLLKNLEGSHENILHFIDGGIGYETMTLSNGFQSDGEISKLEMNFYNDISFEYKNILNDLYYDNKNDITIDAKVIHKAFQKLFDEFYDINNIERIKN